MSYLIKLKTLSETDKAFQLENKTWIPKSILDKRGLPHPYYQIKGWWLLNTIEDYRSGNKTSFHLLEEMERMRVSFRDLPKEVVDNWTKFWSSSYSNFGGYDSDDRRWEISEWDLGIY